MVGAIIESCAARAWDLLDAEIHDGYFVILGACFIQPRRDDSISQEWPLLYCLRDRRDQRGDARSRAGAADPCVCADVAKSYVRVFPGGART